MTIQVTVIHGDLVLEKDTIFKNSIRVEGDIVGKDGKKYNLKVKGNIVASGDICTWNITSSGRIYAWNIVASGDITALRKIDSQFINANGNIKADFIVCGQLKQPEGKKLVCKNLIETYGTYKLKEVKR